MRIALVSIKWIKHKVTKQLHWVMSLTITDAEADSLTYLKLFWWTEQKSKNLLDKDDETMQYDGYLGNTTVWEPSKLSAYAGWDKTIFVKVNPNTTYTVSRAIGISTRYDRIRVASFTSKPVTNATGTMLYNLSSNTTTATAVITTLSDTEYIAINVRNSGTVGDDRQQFLDAFLVYQWTSQTPTPDSPIDIISNNGAIKWGVTSKNLFNKDQTPYTTWKYLSSVTMWQPYRMAATTANANYNIYRIEIKPNTTYTFGIIKANAPRRVVTDSSDIIIDRWGNDWWTDWRNITITTGATAKYLYLSVWVAWTYKCDDILQLEVGSEHTSYVPYTEWIYCAWPIETVQDSLWNTATAEMLLKVWDYQDEQDVISGSVTRKVGIKVLDWTESWTRTGTWNFYNVMSDVKNNVTDDGTIVCTHFGQWTRNTPSTNEVSLRLNYNGLLFNNGGSSTLEQRTQRLADQYAAWTPVIVVYPLATETTESVTPQSMNVRSGNNTIEITQAGLDDLELEIEYNWDS